MTPVIGHYGGYRKTLSFGLTCLVYHATTLFCRRNYNYKNDALGKTVGQMEGAARSARQNIVEGSSRAGTSKETELKLLDVAKASLQELAGDFEAFIVDAGEAPWSESDANYVKVKRMAFDDFESTGDLRHEYGKHLLAMRERFAPALENEDPIVAANAILVTIDRACALLHRQIEKIGEDFREQGGFTEHLTKVRLEARDAAIAASDAPKCPKCGGPMRKVVAKKGTNAGNPFWSCHAYPNCNGTRKWEWK
jgi:four helix bundle suffix protein